MSNYFSVTQRDEHHWDISDGDHRCFAIRGEPGNVYVRDERSKGAQSLVFRTIGAAMAYVCDEMMSPSSKGRQQ